MTSTAEGFDKEYQDKITSAVLKAIMLASMDEAKKTAMLRNEDISEALIGIMAVMMATSKELKSRTALRKWCEDFSKRLQRLIIEAQSQPPPFDVIHVSEKQ
jgi:hypothetical protein